jgi:hypothetical protein
MDSGREVKAAKTALTHFIWRPWGFSCLSLFYFYKYSLEKPKTANFPESPCYEGRQDRQVKEGTKMRERDVSSQSRKVESQSVIGRRQTRTPTATAQ